MSAPIRLLIVFLVALGAGTLAWAIGGLAGWQQALLRDRDAVFMDVGGAFGIGVGALAGAGMCYLLFRAPSSTPGHEKPRAYSNDLS